MTILFSRSSPILQANFPQTMTQSLMEHVYVSQLLSAASHTSKHSEPDYAAKNMNLGVWHQFPEKGSQDPNVPFFW